MKTNRIEFYIVYYLCFKEALKNYEKAVSSGIEHKPHMQRGLCLFMQLTHGINSLRTLGYIQSVYTFTGVTLYINDVYGPTLERVAVLKDLLKEYKRQYPIKTFLLDIKYKLTNYGT